MKAQILTGSKSEIAETVARMDGEIHEVIVFLADTSDSTQVPSEGDLFAEMEPFMVEAGGADYSRQSLYCRMEGE